jgi:MerR-like DNA binding protein
MRNDMTIFIESGDVQRMLGVSREGVFYLMRRGRLRPVARTRRGVWLFDASGVERLRVERGRMRSKSVAV